MGTDKWFLLSRLRRAVKKLRFLLNFNVNRWRVASMIGSRSFGPQRRFSFNDRPGLTGACYDDSGSDDQDRSGSSRGLQRTISYPSDQDDIDQRAEMFISNFRRQLQMERQVSLELRYYNRGNSFEWRSP
ncbi:cotton fiber protein [Parasponia andersonii]|uniref:Cotton fiber protein n=1 Tax=Parasponia andersonii TaxID=3476 RepID=A0A2P5C729_PARAD|nr:cotton fiber protein [Parasponia andersonii]